jgi:hypothetical protein
MPAQPHSAQHVHLEKPQPVFVRDILERLDLENPQIVDQDVYLGKPLNRGVAAFYRAKVRRESLDLTPNLGALQVSQSFLYAPAGPFTMTRAPSRASASTTA